MIIFISQKHQGMYLPIYIDLSINEISVVGTVVINLVFPFFDFQKFLKYLFEAHVLSLSVGLFVGGGIEVSI